VEGYRETDAHHFLALGLHRLDPKAPSVGAIDESTLRHPSERIYFYVLVAVNFLLLGLGIALLFHEPSWIKNHPILSKQVQVARFLAWTALIGIPFLALQRNRREASIRGNSIRVSKEQFPEVYAVLEDHCRRLGMTQVPELFLTGGSIAPFSQTFSSWRENYIVIHQIIFDIDMHKKTDVLAFILGHELGAIRLKQTTVINEMLLTYVSAVKWLRNPLSRARTYSRDRYGATLAPTGFRGLLINAAGRRLMEQVDIEEYLKQSRQYGGLWSNLNIFFDGKPAVYSRINQLRKAGFSYKPPEVP
jgi:Zn-dependent protease with chaperone function